MEIAWLVKVLDLLVALQLIGLHIVLGLGVTGLAKQPLPFDWAYRIE